MKRGRKKRTKMLTDSQIDIIKKRLEGIDIMSNQKLAVLLNQRTGFFRGTDLSYGRNGMGVSANILNKSFSAKHRRGIQPEIAHSIYLLLGKDKEVDFLREIGEKGIVVDYADKTIHHLDSTYYAFVDKLEEKYLCLSSSEKIKIIGGLERLVEEAES